MEFRILLGGQPAMTAQRMNGVRNEKVSVQMQLMAGVC